MSNFTLVSSSTLDLHNQDYPFNNEAAALAAKAVIAADLVADGWTVDEWDSDCFWKSGNLVSLDIEAEVDEENESPWSEYEQGWRNIREDERAAVARQVAEDAAWANRPQSSYQGVRGTWQGPEEGWIYEP